MELTKLAIAGESAKRFQTVNPAAPVLHESSGELSSLSVYNAGFSAIVGGVGLSQIRLVTTCATRWALGRAFLFLSE